MHGMQSTKVVSFFFAFVLALSPGLLAQDKVPNPSARVTKETVSWSMLGDRLDGKRVHVGLSDATVVSGRVESVQGDHIQFAGGTGQQSGKSVPRAQVKFIQYDIFKGKSRAGWSTGLMLAGASLFTLWVARVENSIDINTGQYIAGTIGIGVASGVAGYAMGRSLDRRTIILSIQPGP